MRRSDSSIKAIAVILLIAIVSYMGFHIADYFINPLQTTSAVTTVVTESGTASGYVIRNEHVLTGTGVIAPAADGKKVMAGGIVAVVYESEDALNRADEIMELEARIDHLEEIVSSKGGAGIYEAIKRISRTLAGGDLTDLDSVLYNAEYAVTGAGDEEADPETQLEELNNRLYELRSIQTGFSNIYTGSSGIFSSAVDGFEHISPSKLENLTPERLESMFDEPSRPDNSFGKMVYGTKWYFAAVVSQEDAARLEEGKSAQLVFTKNYSADISMTVESIGAVSDGMCAVVFSSESGLAGVSSVRNLEAEITFSSHSGIPVNNNAIYTDDRGQSFVYILVGLQAKLVYVDIVCPYGDGYSLITAAKGSILNDGSEIIVKAGDLEDGKVVK